MVDPSSPNIFLNTNDPYWSGGYTGGANKKLCKEGIEPMRRRGIGSKGSCRKVKKEYQIVKGIVVEVEAA